MDDIEMLIEILTLVSALLAAWLTYYFRSKSERERRLADLIDRMTNKSVAALADTRLHLNILQALMGRLLSERRAPGEQEKAEAENLRRQILRDSIFLPTSLRTEIESVSSALASHIRNEFKTPEDFQVGDFQRTSKSIQRCEDVLIDFVSSHNNIEKG